ncbi:MAG: HlyU family transcriptional regulator [Kiloniellales bacterium]|nr:HlyU family transcriptional regulator [Kiloniellales bacterium]
MALGKLLRALVGGGEAKEAAAGGTAFEYQGYIIRATPRRQGAQWLTVGVIAKEIDGELKEQSFIRADTHPTREDAENCAIGKAKNIIDQQGEDLFGRNP